MVQGPTGLAGTAVAEPALGGGHSAAVSLARLSAGDKRSREQISVGFVWPNSAYLEQLFMAYLSSLASSLRGILAISGKLSPEDVHALLGAWLCRVGTGTSSLTASGTGHCPSVTQDLMWETKSRSTIEHGAA